LPDWVGTRKDCADGRHCSRQRDISHAKEFNHIIGVGNVPALLDEPQATQSAGAGPSTSNEAPSLPPIGESSTSIAEDLLSLDPFQFVTPPSQDTMESNPNLSDQMDVDSKHVHVAPNEAVRDVVMEEIASHSGPIITPSEGAEDLHRPSSSSTKASDAHMDVLSAGEEGNYFNTDFSFDRVDLRQQSENQSAPTEVPSTDGYRAPSVEMVV